MDEKQDKPGQSPPGHYGYVWWRSHWRAPSLVVVIGSWLLLSPFVIGFILSCGLSVRQAVARDALVRDDVLSIGVALAGALLLSTSLARTTYFYRRSR